MNKLITTKPAEIWADNYCGHCGERVGLQDNFCRNCGTGCHISIGDVVTAERAIGSVGHGNQTPVALNRHPSTLITDVLSKRWMVIGIIALIGPMGLPALWFSPRFSRITKIVATALYVLLSAAIPILLVWYFLDYSMQPLVDVFRK